MPEKLLLIDGHSLMFRAFYGMPLSMTGPGGVHTNALYGFLAVLNKMLEEEKPDYLAVAFDLPEPTFRHQMYPEYKGNRSAAPDEFHEQMPLIKDLLAAMEIPCISLPGWEADDILGTLAVKAKEHGIEAEIVSGDRDLLQMADEGITVILPRTKGGETSYERYTPEAVLAAYGVTPKQFIEMKALMGDNSDNIPGLPGVGPKTAQKIIAAFGSIADAREHLDEIKPKKAMEAMRDFPEKMDLAKDLVTIRTNAPVELDLQAFRVENVYTPAAYEKFKYLGFKSLLRHFDAEEPAVPERTELRIIRTRKEAEEACAAFAEKERIGISLCEMEGKHVLGLSDGEEKTAILSGAMLSGADLTAAAEQLAAKVPCLSACGIKQLRKRCTFDFGPQFFDCRIAGYLLNPLKSEWSYDVISADYLGRTVPSRTELLGKKGLSALGAQAEEKMAECAAYEAEVSFLTQPVLLQKLQETGMEGLFREIEMPLAFVLAEMELAGILCSESELAAYGSRLEKRINELTAAIYEEAGEVFNLNSPKQLGQILFEKLQLPGGKKTKTGYSTAADVLEKLAAHEPIAANILEYRTYSKLKSTYADGLAAYIGEDGRIRTTFHQTVTATGRLSSADPNLQNIPMREELGRLIRKCFYPAEGCVFVDADYSQIELRILAHMAGDEKLIEAYREAKDIHRITASQVFHVPFEEVTDEMRRNAKAVNFGIVYGISSFGLSQGLSISRQEAADYIELYFAAYPGVRKFLDALVASAKETGYAVSLFGRRRPIPELRAANFMQRSFGERAAMNSPIQGTAADIMKIAMLRVSRRLKEEQKKARIILQIHDELLVEAPEDEAEDVRRILTEEMAEAAQLRVALETDCHIGRDWYEAK